MRYALLLVLLLYVSNNVLAVMVDFENVDGAILLQQYSSQISDPKYNDVVAALKSNDFDQARFGAKELIARYPSEYTAHLLFLLTNIPVNDDLAIKKHLMEIDTYYPKYSLPLRLNLFNAFKSYNRYFRALEWISGIDEQLLPANTLRSKGEIYLAQRRYDDAFNAFAQAIEKDPLDNDAKYELARIHVVNGEFLKAIAIFNSMGAEKSQNIKLLQLLAASYLGANDLKQSEKIYKSIEKLMPEDFLANLNAGVFRLIDDDLITAKTYFNKATIIDSQSVDAWVGLLLTETASSYASITKSVPEAVKDDPLYGLLVLALLKQQDQSQIRLASQLLPDLRYISSASVTSFDRILFSSLLYRLGYYQEVVNEGVVTADDLSIALEKIIIARSLIKLGKSIEAAEIYKTLIEESVVSVSPNLELAGIKYENRDILGAIENYKQLLSIDGSRLDWAFQLSNLYIEAKKPHQAINLLEPLRKNNANPYIENQLAAIYSEILLDDEKALSISEQALKQYPNQPILYDTAAWSYYKLKNYKKADQYYKVLLSLTGMNQSPQTFYRIGLNYDKLDDQSKSKLFYELALNAGKYFEGMDDAVQNLDQ